MRRTSPWSLPPGRERRERLRRLDVSVTAEDFTAEELAATKQPLPAGERPGGQRDGNRHTR
jgi:hypothetical protein